MKYKKGERVTHPAKSDWGVGQVLADSTEDSVRIHFANVGEKTLSLSYVQPQIAIGGDATSELLDKLEMNEQSGVVDRNFEEYIDVENEFWANLDTEMPFEIVYRLLFIVGSITVPHRTASGVTIDVWSSTLQSGISKGSDVIRIQWQRSQSTIDSSRWSRPETSAEKQVKTSMLVAILSSDLMKNRIRKTLENSDLSETKADFIRKFQAILKD